ncbi:MAG: DUF4325 domain-containing protein [Gemmatimonadota bacterium]|nr:DUF4325 domain-containing protein [Gemmatimonadota bacterium]
MLVDERVSIGLIGTEEDLIWRDLVRPKVALAATPSALAICEYGFTEILNNAIDHSGASTARVLIQVSPVHIRLSIHDEGIGIFKKIAVALSLEDEHLAILELAKGKLTTDPARHSGEGIFFTSRAMDTFDILSGKLRFVHSIRGYDFLVDDSSDIAGTYVEMNLDSRSTRNLREVFDEYADTEGGFTKTIVPVELAKYGDENLISRSQAKRILSRLERFRQVIFDFKNVNSIGQGFADELFRVFAQNHPAIKLLHTNTNSDVARMISHVLAESSSRTRSP